MTNAKKPSNKIDGYVGLFAHTFSEDGRIEHQLQVKHQLPDGRLVCQMFSFISGFPTTQKTYTLDETKGWAFYTNSSDWTDSYHFKEDLWKRRNKKFANAECSEELKAVSHLEVLYRINTKLADQGLVIKYGRLCSLGLCIYDQHGMVHKSNICLDAMADEQGVLADDEFLCWPEEAAKLAA